MTKPADTPEWETLPELALMLADLTRERNRLLRQFDDRYIHSTYPPKERPDDR